MLWVVVPGLVLVVVGVAAFAGLLDAVQERDDITVFDRPVLAWLVSVRGDTATAVLSAVTLVSGPVVLPILVAAGCLTWGLVRREWWRPLLLVAAMVGSTLLSLAIKGLVARPRPPLDTMDVPGSETTQSFPSGHTIGAATLLLVAGYLVASRRLTARAFVVWIVAAVVGIGAVGLSRLYLGYHFLTDVLGAVALAVAVLGIVTVVDRLHVLRGLPPGEPPPRWRPRQDSNLQPTD